MLVSNFDFLYNCDIPPKIAESCQKAEMMYISGLYGVCAVLCRQAAELVIKWIFDEEIFFNKPVWYTNSSKFADMLTSTEFVKGIGDRFIVDEVDQIRKDGNKSIHDLSADIEIEDAHKNLQILFRFMMRVYNQIYEPPYSANFIEPCYDYDEEEPLERDYDALIKEEKDPEERAKLALLKKCEDSKFDLTPFVQELDEQSNIKRLITTLTDAKVLRRTLTESSIQLRNMIGICYRGYDYREELTVVVYAIKACRALVRASYKSIRKYLDAAESDIKFIEVSIDE